MKAIVTAQNKNIYVRITHFEQETNGRETMEIDISLLFFFNLCSFFSVGILQRENIFPCLERATELTVCVEFFSNQWFV